MNKPQALLLTGFMGTGKSTLAQAIADKTGQPLIDTDALIQERSGLSVPAIFAQQGEAGFRAWEAAICAELSQDERPLIISGGGGMLLSPQNRQAFANATVICLNARPDVIYKRVKHQHERPLLAVENPLQHIQDLLKQRRMVYKSFRWQIDTSDASLPELRDEIIRIWEHERHLRSHEQRVRHPEGTYPLIIEHGALNKLPDFLDIYGLAGRRTLIVSNTTVGPLYGEKLTQLLPKSALITVPDGEIYKTQATVSQLYDEFAQHGLDRSGVVIALGGGVIGDTVGYAAASYMRGVRFVQIPTSLLAMVDSSVGGKVGVDIPQGKNLVGAFKQPDLVVIDPDVLASLPPAEYRAGMAELIKHGFLANPDLINSSLPIVEQIRAAVQVKIEIVQRDPYEQGERAYLNLGHTFAHAIEQVSGYTWRHGDAVAVGLLAAAQLSHALGLSDGDLSQETEAILRQIGLPTRYQDLDPVAIWQAMHTDKKWRNGQSHFVILHAVGMPDMISGVSRELVLEILQGLKA